MVRWEMFFFAQRLLAAKSENAGRAVFKPNRTL
jgi:hypothetical protein